ncbi:MAG: acyl-CoA desaturase [Cyclobacteriaceae bacterium]
MPIQPKFKPTVKSEFSRILRERVNSYFKDGNISTHANGEMVVKSILLTISWFGVYYFLIFGNLPLAYTFPLWGLLGAIIALVCVNIGHDAIHGAYTKKKWLKNILCHTFNINGASAYMWKISHNHAHHTYTNVHGHDEDITPGDFFRISPETPLLKIHKYQHIYAFFSYTLATLSWVFAKDYVQFFQNKINNYDQNRHSVKEYFLLFFYKILNYSIYLVIPIMVMPFSWTNVVGGYLIMHAVSGFYLAIIFMLAHAVEEVHFPLPDEEGVIEDDWIIHQMHTTANFATRSWLAGFLTGGLNTQIEHHLFANICSIHYRPLSKIIKDTCEEYGMPYYDIPTFGAAIASHWRFLKKMGESKDYKPTTPKLNAQKVKLAHA